MSCRQGHTEGGERALADKMLLRLWAPIHIDPVALISKLKDTATVTVAEVAPAGCYQPAAESHLFPIALVLGDVSARQWLPFYDATYEAWTKKGALS